MEKKWLTFDQLWKLILQKMCTSIILTIFFLTKDKRKNISIVDWHFHYLLYAYERRISLKERQFTNY